MANNRNNNKKQQQQKPKRYTGKNVNEFSGPVQLAKDAKAVLRNIAFGNFNMEKEGYKLQNHDWLNAAIMVCREEANKHYIIYSSVEYAHAGTTDVQVLSIIEQHRRGMDAWWSIAQTLDAYRMTGDLGLIYGMMYRMPDYRHVM